MHTVKKVLTLALALVLVLTLLPLAVGFPASAETSIVKSGTDGVLQWSIDTAGTLTIFGTGDMSSRSTVGSYPWADDRDSILKIVVQEGVTSIGCSAFSRCNNLVEVQLPEGLTAIQDKAFINCASLATVDLPTSLETLGYLAFGYCVSLNMVTVPRDITDWEGDHGDSSSSSGNAGCCFRGCTGLTSATLSNGLSMLPVSIFEGCTSLTEITIPASVKTVESRAFYDCSALKSICFGAESGVTIADDAIPAGVTVTYGTPTPSEPESTAPATTEPEPTEPVSTEPQPTDPQPTDPPQTATFKVNGTDCALGKPASGAGWSYDGESTVTLKNYIGDPSKDKLLLPGGLTVRAEGANTLYGIIRASGSLTLALEGSLCVDCGDDAITATDLTVIGGGTLTADTTGQNAILAETAEFTGGSTVTLMAGSGGKALNCPAVSIGCHTLWLSANAEQASLEYDGSEYLRLEVQTNTYTLCSNGGQWEGTSAEQKQITLPIWDTFDPNDHTQLLSRPGYAFVEWQQQSDGVYQARWAPQPYAAHISADGTQVLVTIYDAIPAGHELLLTGYTAPGQMVHCAWGSPAEGGWIFDWHGDAAITQWQIHHLSADLIPQADPIDVTIIN